MAPYNPEHGHNPEHGRSPEPRYRPEGGVSTPRTRCTHRSRDFLLVGGAIAGGGVIAWGVFKAPVSIAGRIVFDAAATVLCLAVVACLVLLVRRAGHGPWRRIARRGDEGWATVMAVRTLAPPQPTGVVTQIRLRLVVPGSPPYSGTIMRAVSPCDRAVFQPGVTIPIRVDPHDRDRILVHPRPMPR